MSLTSVIPPNELSHFQSSKPLAPSEAVKNSVPLTEVAEFKSILKPLFKAATIAVPASVPSVFQMSVPLTGSGSVKKSAPSRLTSCRENELTCDTCAISTVPCDVPSLVQSWSPKFDKKNIRLPPACA